MTDTIPFARPDHAPPAAAPPKTRPDTPANPPANFAPESPDVAVAALPLFNTLRDELREALRYRDLRRTLEARSPDARWGVPALFYFDPRLQAELERSRPGSRPDPFAQEAAALDPAGHAAWRALPDRLDDALCVLTSSPEARHAARATPGLVGLADAVAGEHARVGELRQVLAVTDDEVVRVIHPRLLLGVRVLARGVADVAEFHRLLAEVIPGPRWQFFRPEALRRDGTLPQGFAGADRWLWGREPLRAVPRLDGERTVLIDSPEHPVTETESTTRNRVRAELQILETLSEEAVTAWITAATGHTPTRRELRRAA